MAAQPKYSQRMAREPQEDCRDYLRTGRCKYGATCKYNHPANVQSGGGLKPLDPSEPQFPMRPGEPTCQYYVKHGTCKFGQACKFHHPPQSEVTASLVGGGTVVVNVGRNNGVGTPGAQPIALSSHGDYVGVSATALQFLPQRPDEPDCIYFLRNGRCKYGATCRYHHPVLFHQSNPSDVHGSQMYRQQEHPGESTVVAVDATRIKTTGQVQDSRGPSAHYIRAQPSSGYDLQGRPRDPGSSERTPTHFVVTETPLAVMSGTTNGASNSYIRIARSSIVGEEYSMPLNAQGHTRGVPAQRDVVSSSSSLASSYETAGSTMDLLQQQGQGEQSNNAWSRPVRRIGSGGSLAAYNSTPPLRPQVPYNESRSSLVPSVSDNSIASRGVRTESIGSASDNSAVYEDMWNASSHHGSAGHAGWIRRSSSFDRPRAPAPPNAQVECVERNILHDSRLPQSSLQRRADTMRESEKHADAGLSMMTSALLNMLDTPEEAAMKSYTVSEESIRRRDASPPVTPRSGHASDSQALEAPLSQDRYLSSSAPGRDNYAKSRVGAEQQTHTSRYHFTSTEYTPNHSQVDATRKNTAMYSHQGGQSSNWSPTWQGAVPAQSGPDRRAPAISVIPQPARAQDTQLRPSQNIVSYLP